MERLFQSGDLCGGLRIVGFLGAGGFSEVYEAVDPEGALRALKIVRSPADAANLGSSFAAEIEALMRIEHVNVVQVHGAGVEDDRVYLVLELVLGVTLRHKIGDPYALAAIDDIVRWIQQACEGVAEAHRVGVIHRDLKPANILVTASGLVKVIDFGVAKLRVASLPSDHLVGTALYMAPEQLQGRATDARTDVYAMGAILYQALCGAHPLGLEDERATVFEIFQAHLLDEPRPIQDVAPDVPDDLAALVHHALAKDPARRLPTMRAFADELREVLAKLPPTPASTPRVTLIGLGSEPPRSRRSFAAAVPISTRPQAEASPLSWMPVPEGHRSAYPPPPPRASLSSNPQPISPRQPISSAQPISSRRPSSSRAPSPRPSPALLPPPPSPEPARPSAARGSSAVPVVAEAAAAPRAGRWARWALILALAVLAGATVVELIRGEPSVTSASEVPPPLPAPATSAVDAGLPPPRR